MGLRTQRVVRSIRKTMLLVAGLSVMAVGLMVVETLLQGPVSKYVENSGWGGESLDAAPGKASILAQLGVANACGLGASSCFKCHDGKRADAPNMDTASAPWHPDHTKVNHSCAGCHGGNPRIIRKEMSHRKLIANPNQTPDQSCVSCHAEQTDEYVKRYLMSSSGGK